MKYYASDIIKKARIAADLVNSDFIDWYEEVSLINDSYQMLYQNLTDINDPAFVKIIETTDKIIELPDDFQQLRCVTLLRNGFSTPILRRSFSESYNSMSYEIIENEIHINTPYIQSPPDGVYHIEYFSAPITLLFPPKKKQLFEFDKTNGRYGTYGIYSNKNNIVIISQFGSDNYKVSLYDYEGNIISYNTGTTPYFVAITDEYLIIKYTTITRVYRLDEDGLNSPYTRPNDTYNVVIAGDGSVYFMDRDKKVYDLSDTDTAIRIMDDWPVYLDNFHFTKDSAYFTDESWSDCWYVDESKIMHFYDIVLYESGENIVLSQPFYRGGILYGKSNDNFININNDNTYFIKRIPELQSIGTLDENSGLSLLTYNNGFLYLEPWVNDTLLNYPNSFFFQVLVYSLAVQYKIKQNADASGLEAIYQSYYNNFIKSLPQDVYMPTRINNVYTY